MQYPKDRYLTDPMYKSLVDMLESYIHRAEFTPSELREAAILASINYESKQARKCMLDLTPELHKQLDDLHQMIGVIK